MNKNQRLNNYLSNLESEWQLAYQNTLQQIEAQQEPTSLVDCIHNALIRSSLNTFAENLTPKIIARLFETDLWSLEDILTLVSIIPDHYRKAQNYVALLETGKLDHTSIVKVRETLLETANAINFAAYRSWAMEELAKYSDADIQLDLLSKAVDAAFAEANHYYENTAYTLLELIPKVPETMLEQLEPRILTLKYADARAWALSHLARRTKSGDHQYFLLEQGLEAAAQINSDVKKANALLQLANQLSGDLVPKALDLALSINEGNWRPRAVEDLMDKLNENQVKRVLESILTIEDDWWRADGIISVIEHSSGETQQKALTNLLSIEGGEAYSKMAVWLARFTNTQSNIDITIQAAQEIKNDQQRSSILERLKPVTEEKEAQSQTLNFPDLIDLRNQHITLNYAFQDRLENIFQIEWEEERAYALASFVQHMPDELIPLVIERSKKFLEWLHRDAVLDKLAPRLNGDILKTAIQEVADYDDTSSLIDVLSNIAPYLDQQIREKILSYALETVLVIGVPGWRITDPLLKLKSVLDGDLKQKATDHLPDDLKATTYETVVNQRNAESLKRFEDDPEFKKRFDEEMAAAREYYAAHPELIPVPVVKEPQNPIMEFLEGLSQTRHKKREAVFWICLLISKLIDQKALSLSIIPAITSDIIDIHKNWHWP